MSFYGNSYYYTAETFARIVLHNAGLNETNFPSFNSNKIDIEAQHRDAGLDVKTGNRWIGLTPETQGFSIYHNKADQNTTTFINPLNTLSSKPHGVEDKDIIKLNFDQLLLVPRIFYDKAGHVSKVEDCAVFKMPNNPTKDMNDRLDLIDKDSPGSLKYDLNHRMNLIDGQDNEPKGSDCLISNIEDQLESKMKEIDDEIASIREYKEKIDRLYTYVVDGEPPLYHGLLTRVSVLESAIPAEA